ncbi:MAG: hybrid sensor histidine kinase/response regulator [Clostridia bacterium]|nr:hybrid sensor histidine kinase/response regulator [Clostridia bacterium]
MLQNEEFIHEFVEEAMTNVEKAESGLLKLDDASEDLEQINTIFRAIHSIKGTAGFFGLKKIVELSHSMENVLGELRNNRTKIDRELIDLLLASNDCLKGMILEVGRSEECDISKYTIKLAAAFERGRLIAEKQTDKLSDNDSTSERIIIEEGRRHGHKLYRVRLLLNEDLGKKNITPIKFFNKIQSIGNIVDSKTDLSSIEDLDKCLNSEITFTFLFTTVLEKGLLPMALDIPESRIEELDSNTKTEDLLNNAGKTQPFVQHKSGLHNQYKKEEQEKEAIDKKNQPVVFEDSVRVHVSLLNNLLNLASEMVLGRNQLLRAMERYRKDISGIEPILQNIDRITTELQEKVMQTRMQPISNVFNKFPRIIRDLSRKLGKEIELQLEGTEVELDKSIIEALGDPLTHLVRNAADHGLELPEIREQKGKPRVGRIVLKAYHEGGYVNIDIVDDGAGINLEKIKKKALEKELASKSDVASMSDQEVLQLLFKPGFSTAERITDVSGRGVGMDVVKTNIEKLGGTIEIFTSAGAGTTFRLLLPLTLAIIPSLIVEVEKQKFALPQANLQEIVRIRPGEAARKIEYVHNSEVLRLRGRLLPIVHLADVLGLVRTYKDPLTGETKEDRRKTLYDRRRMHFANAETDISNDSYAIESRRSDLNNIIRILVLKIGSRRFGVAVDAIHGSEEILVKPLSKYIKNSKCYSGVTIMGDGKTAMILDPDGIISKANLRFVEDGEDKITIESKENEERLREQQNLLLFKCSGPETFAIDLSMVSRVEEIKRADIDKVGDKEFIKFRGSSLRVIRPEDYLPVAKHESMQDRLYVIVPKLVKHPIGILIEKIDDTVLTSIRLNEEVLSAKGLMGSAIINKTMVLLINMYELFELADPHHYAAALGRKAREEKVVLVAEDTPFFQRMERSYLEGAGYKVLLAQNGREALQFLQENKVDVVVSDINMPVLDGLELVRKIREDDRLRNLPVIAVTSLTGEQQKKAGFEAGFDFYEFKLDRAVLLDRIEQALQERRRAV